MGRTSAVKTYPRIATTLGALAAALLVCAVLAGAALAGTAAAAPRIDPGAPRIDPGASTSGVAPRVNPLGARAASSSTSRNWAGYSVSGGTHTSVTATWTQPAVAASAAETYAAFWVGLDGDGNVSHDSVEQIGTLGYTFGGATYYSAWYEMYPYPMQEITSLTISPGDVVTATVLWTGSSTFKLTLRDFTTGQSFTTAVADPKAERVSAEVIAEAPSDTTGVLPLAPFGLVGFSAASVDGVSLAAAGASSIDMVDSTGKTIAATSELSADGTSFTVSDDFTGPTVTASGLQSSATSGWKNAPVRVSLKGSDGAVGSGVAAVYYTVDGGATQTYSGAFTVSGAGSHTVTYWAVDKAGNTGPEGTGYVNLDLRRPRSAPAAVRISRAGAARRGILLVPVSVSDAPPTSGSVTLVTKVVDGAHRTVLRVTRTGVAANATKAVRVRLRSRLDRGTYTVRTVATDAAGNVQARAGRATLTVR